MDGRRGLWLAVGGTFGGSAAVVFLLAGSIFGGREATALLAALTAVGGCYLFDGIDRLECTVVSLTDTLNLTKAMVHELARKQTGRAP